MTTHTSETSTGRALRPPRAGRSNGQWAVDGRDPLNANEAWKQEDGGLNVRARIEQVYAKEGFASIPPEDLSGRFRWWGLYTQRKPGIDGGRTAQLDDTELSDEYFMLRVRLDGGALTLAQLRVLADLSHEFARGTADISDRQNIQYHWIRVEDVPEIWRRLEAVGLQTTEACGDTPRVILGSPLAGIAADEILDPTPVIDEITRRFVGDPELANLPRKFKSAITGHPSLDVVHEINDISLVGVVHPELGAGYDLWVGGGLSTAPRLAERIGVFVTPEQAADVWLGVISIFRDYGYRRMRTKARLKFLMAEWGPEKFRQVLETEYLGHALPDGPPPAPATGPGDHVGVHLQKDGNHYVGAAPVVGRISGDVLTGLADLMEAAGTDRVRLTPHQKLVVLDVAPGAVDDLVAGLEGAGLSVSPSPFRRHTMACTGIEFCKLAIVETKATAATAIAELERRLADVTDQLDTPVTLNVNGCPNSCARIQVADIGLKGMIVTTDGEQGPGFQVHLGGGLASQDRDEAGLGRTVRGLKVTAADLPDLVERLVRRWLDQREARRDVLRLGPPRRRGGAPMTTTTTPTARRGTDELRALAEQGARELGPDATADEVAAWAARTFPGTLAVACSMADAVLPAVVANHAPGVDVLFLDTGYHFAETYGTRAQVAHELDVTIVDVLPTLTVAEQDAEYGPRLYERDPAACCRMRKVEPLKAALGGYEAWVTGIRRDEGPTRADTPLVTFDEQFGLVKLNPLAAWTFDEVVDYANDHRVPVNLLLSDGYPSIGCEPCTQRVAPGDDPRAGRWAGFAKTECGLHP